MPSRRALLTGLSAALFAGTLGRASAVAFGAAGRGAWLGTRLDPDGRHWLSLFDEEGASLLELPLPARGHGAALHPGGRLAVLLARRPGDYALVLDPRGQVRRFAPGAGRFFCGHGAFAAEGRLFVATEQDDESEQGWLAVYDVEAGFAPLAAHATGGIDPHQVLVLPDGMTAAVANGGLSTDPFLRGQVLNLDEMDSSLALIDLRDGSLRALARLPPDLSRLSVRHLALLPDGRLAAGLQHQGAATDRVPLVALYDGGAALMPLRLPADQVRLLRGYVGSIAASDDGALLAVTSPRGGVALVVDSGSGQVLRQAALPDVCGLAVAGRRGDFLLASGLAGVQRFDAAGLRPLPTADPLGAWDNHLLALGAGWSGVSGRRGQRPGPRPPS